METKKIEIETRILISPALDTKKEMDQITLEKVSQVSDMFGEPESESFLTVFFRNSDELGKKHPVVRLRYYPSGGLIKTTVKKRLDTKSSNVRFEDERELSYSRGAVWELASQALNNGYSYYAYLETTRYRWYRDDTNVELSCHFPFSIQFELERVVESKNVTTAEQELKSIRKQTTKFAQELGEQELTDEKYNEVWDVFWNNRLVLYKAPDDIVNIFVDYRRGDN